MADAKASEVSCISEDAATASTASFPSPLASKDPIASQLETPLESQTPLVSKQAPIYDPASIRRAERMGRFLEGKQNCTAGADKYAHYSFMECERCRLQFRRMLEQRGGSVIGGWKLLDINNDCKLSFFEFSRACAKHLDVKAVRELWFAMDLDRSGYVSLREVDPALDDELRVMGALIRNRFGSVNEAWRTLNKSNVPRVSEHDFVRVCNELNFPGDARSVFAELGNKSLGMSKKEFIYLNHWVAPKLSFRQEVRRDVEPEAKMSRWEKTRSEPVLLPGLDARRRKTLSQEFKDLLLKSYVNFVRAWRQGLDIDHNNRLEYKEFVRAVKDVGFAGKPRELWQELDLNGNGWVSLWELDAETAQRLLHFKAAAEATHLCWEAAWHEAMDVREDDRVKLLDFKEGCKQIKYRGETNKLFELLDVDQNKYLTWETVAWLDTMFEEEQVSVKAPAAKVTDASGFILANKYKTPTVQQRRRAETNARNHRNRAKQFEGRARGEIPGSSAAAGTSMFQPGAIFTKSTSLPALQPEKDMSQTQSSFFSQTSTSTSFHRTGASFHREGIPAKTTFNSSQLSHDYEMTPIEEPEWLLVAEGRASVPVAPAKMNLSFPLAPQAPGKGGWPCKRLNLIDPSWGGTKDIGQSLSEKTRRACTLHNLTRWRKQAQD
eukprot:TRINITY_DN27394_c0_g2_i1.p1 TRINITY_DN27394_c0_g2~~TRINITY_DN27394_c0_g2_i1.p1  ORF type:complete len:691 (+),score=138.37 TRINITY_DN27394_c0_g2_i1:83-2074(+)